MNQAPNDRLGVCLDGNCKTTVWKGLTHLIRPRAQFSHAKSQTTLNMQWRGDRIAVL